jgi:hypothetical protein
MKRILASIGLVAVGATSIHAQNATGLTENESAKLVTVSGALRGFYDDNPLTQVDALKHGAWGLEASPSISLNKKTDTTLFRADALYDLKHYDATPEFNDQSVVINGLVDTQFNEANDLKVKDSFALAQEPEVLDEQTGVTSTPLRAKGNNIRNTASADYLADLSSLLQIEVDYNASVYHYQSAVFKPLLDRLDQFADVDARFKLTSTTTAVVGYRFDDTSYDGDQILSGTTKSSIRDNRSHFGMAGFDTKVAKDFTASVRVGAEFFDYYHYHKTQTSPYADGSLSYNYMSGAYVQAGVKHQHNATDIIGNDPVNNPVLDDEATMVYLQLTQPLTFISPNLVAGLYGSYQKSDFNGNQASGLHDKSEDYYTASGNLTYKFNPWFSVEGGYNYDKLSSDANRAFARNRVYLGVRATY